MTSPCLVTACAEEVIPRSKERDSASCLNYLQTGMAEVGVWVDAMQPVVEGRLLA